jgi:protein-disulfide isomerase
MALSKFFRSTILSTAMIVLSAQIALAQQAGFSDPQKREIEQLVKDYLLANPEILREMAEKLEAKQQEADQVTRLEGLKSNAKAVYALPGDPVSGNVKGDVTLVEFMDYNCGWCKRSVGEVAELMKSDKNLRVVFKELPIFGAGSEYAAKAALAANKQGKYWELHQALFAQEGSITEAVVDQVAEGLKLDMAKLKADMASDDVTQNLAANAELAKMLALNGTPAFIIDADVAPGYLPLTALQERVAAVRANGGCKIC